jgi:translation initiation factor IF-2
MPNTNETPGVNEDLNPDDFTSDDEVIDDDDDSDDNDEQLDSTNDDSDPAEDGNENVKTQEQLDAEKKAKAEAEKNAYHAKKRREREAAEKAQREKQIRDEATLEAELKMMKVNPYTNEKIVDEEDLKIYKLQKQIEDDGGDPLADLPKALAHQNRKEAQERKKLAEQSQANQNKLAEEAKELFAKYPEAMNTAQNDQELLDLMAEKSGRWTMVECYEHLVQKRKVEANVKKKAQNDQKKKEVVGEATKKYNKTPSSQPNGSKNSEKSVLTMTDEEFEKFWKSKYAN